MTQPEDRIAIQQTMRAAFPEAEEHVAAFYQMQEYHLGWRDEQLAPAAFDPGKLLRPYFVLLGCRAAGGDPRVALPLAAGVQLIHDFSLIHDDIQDVSETRRGRPTVWKLWGAAQGINAGDGMFVIAHLAIHRLSEAGVPAEVVLEVLRRFDQTILSICEGQYLDLSYEGNQEISESDYMSMISRKTAALIAASCGLGAILGGADVALARALFDFGQNLGLGFQAQDDVLGVWGDPEITGKPFAADLLRRKLSLPAIHTLRHAEERDEFASLYASPTTEPGDIRRLLEIMEAAGSRGYTEGVAHDYHRQALAGLSTAEGDQQALGQFRAIAEGLVGRKS